MLSQQKTDEGLGPTDQVNRLLHQYNPGVLIDSMNFSTIKLSKKIIFSATTLSRFFSNLLQTSHGKEKFLAMFQYLFQFYIACTKNSVFEEIRQQYLQNAMVGVRLASSIKNSLSQARKTFRLLRFFDEIKEMQRSLKSCKKSTFGKLLEFAIGFFTCLYFISDNILWLLYIMYISKILKYETEKAWKIRKHVFSLLRIIFSIVQGLYHIQKKKKKEDDLLEQIQEAPDSIIQKEHYVYELVQQYISVRRKRRFDIMQVPLDVLRIFMLYKSLHFYGYKTVDPIFISFCGMAQSVLGMIKTIYKNRIFVQIESEIKNEDDEYQKFLLTEESKRAKQVSQKSIVLSTYQSKFVKQKQILEDDAMEKSTNGTNNEPEKFLPNELNRTNNRNRKKSLSYVNLGQYTASSLTQI